MQCSKASPGDCIAGLSVTLIMLILHCWNKRITKRDCIVELGGSTVSVTAASLSGSTKMAPCRKCFDGFSGEFMQPKISW